MRYAEFLRRVEARGASDLGPERTAPATNAVLGALGQSLPPERAHELASQLPKELQRPLRTTPGGEPPRNADEFLDLVAEREKLSRSEALDHCRAVLNVLDEAITGHEMQHVRGSLPADFGILFKPPAAANWPETHAPRTRL